MPRNKRQKITFSDESIIDLLQEYYNQSCEIRAKAIRHGNRFEKDMKDNADIMAVAKPILDSLKIEQEAVERKFTVAKLLNETIIRKKETEKAGKKGEETIGADTKKSLQMMAEEMRKNNMV